MEKLLQNAEIGVIGGSGFYNLISLNNAEYIDVETPFGQPSEKFLIGNMKGRSVAFLSRHGIGHRFSPSEVNYRANLYALKLLGVKKLISVNAVGSLTEGIVPTSLVIPDQFVDHTHKRESTFFEDGIVAHVSMAEPTCSCLSKIAYETARHVGLDVHSGGTYLNIEGPQFSTRAESELYRKFQFSVIGMTQATESKLAREMEMCFVSLSFVADYDCWHKDFESVSVELIIDNLEKNTENANHLISFLVEKLNSREDRCECQSSLENAFITDPGLMPRKTKEKLAPIISKYISLD